MDRIYLSPPYSTLEELGFVEQAFRSNWVAPDGMLVKDFEAILSAQTASKFVVATISGTAALHLALLTAGVQAGDIVAVPTFAFAAAVNPVLYLGANPVFVASDAQTWCMDANALRDAIRLQKKRPKAIVAVHAYGQPAHIDHILQVSAEFDIPLIEDAAAALGSTYKNRQVGTYGCCGIISFNGNKIVTTSQGGALFTNSWDMSQAARHLSKQAKLPGDGFDHDKVGYNYQLSNVLAGIGLGQLQSLDIRIKRKRTLFERYKQAFSNLPIQMKEEPEGMCYNRWLSNVVFENEEQMLKVSQELEAKNIEYRRLWKPLHMQKYCNEFPYYGNNLSQDLYSRGMSLPSGVGLTEDDQYRVISAIIQSFG